MTDQNADLRASVSHISLMHRPYGPRMHFDENASGGAPAGGSAAGADAGGEGSPVVMAGDTDFNDFSPEQALESLLNRRKKSQSPADGAANTAAPADSELSGEDNVAPGEDQAHGEDEGGDPAEKQPIARPKSWTEAEDAEWQATPRALQEKIVARELERDTALRRTQNEAADKLKGLTAKEQAAEQAKQQYEAKLPALMQALHAHNNTAFSDIKSQDDADLLAHVDPARWVQWQAHQQKMQSVNSELQQAETAKATKHQTEWQTLRNTEDALAAKAIPDLADPEKAPKLMKRAIARLNDLGIDEGKLNELASGKSQLPIFHNVIQQLLFDSVRLADIEKAKATAAPRNVPPVQRPGNAAPNRGAQDTTAIRNKLNGSGDINDAFALYQAKKAARRA